MVYSKHAAFRLARLAAKKYDEPVLINREWDEYSNGWIYVLYLESDPEVSYFTQPFDYAILPDGSFDE